MSTRKDSRKKVKSVNRQLVSRKYELPRDQLVELYRQNAMRTLREVRQGLVNELDVDRLQNFVLSALALMQIVSVDTFRQAQRNAELLGFLKGGDAQVVLDPLKQKKQQQFPPLDLDMNAVVSEAVLQMSGVQELEPTLGQLMDGVKCASDVKTVAIPENQLDDTLALAKQLQDGQ
jgi:hypothetical protein